MNLDIDELAKVIADKICDSPVIDDSDVEIGMPRVDWLLVLDYTKEAIEEYLREIEDE
jgi:hypothetical protein